GLTRLACTLANVLASLACTLANGLTSLACSLTNGLSCALTRTFPSALATTLTRGLTYLPSGLGEHTGAGLATTTYCFCGLPCFLRASHLISPCAVAEVPFP